MMLIEWMLGTLLRGWRRRLSDDDDDDSDHEDDVCPHVLDV